MPIMYTFVDDNQL